MSLSFPNESEEYREARNALLDAEIALRGQIETVAAMRRSLPMGGGVPEDYVFTETDGRQRALSSLFGDHQTLVLYSYMYAPDDARPCPACTSILDGLNGQASQISQRVGFAAVASAGIEKLAALKAERGWDNFPFLSAAGTDYQTRYHGRDGGSEETFMNVFTRDEDTIRHFWGSEMRAAKTEGHPRHVDLIWPIWNVLDMTPEGRGDFFPEVFTA